MTQQGLRQASACDLSGFATETNYNEDLLRLFDAQSIPAGTFNERQLRWINTVMAASYTDLDEAMHAYATSQGAANWSALGALENTVNFTRAMPFGSVYTRTGVATGLTSSGTLQSFAANVPQRTGRGLALEPTATNRALYSSDTTAADWSVTAMTKTTGQADPFGGTGAVLLTGTGGLGARFLLTTAVSLVAYTSGQTYTFSYFVKKGTQSLVQITGPGAVFGVLQYANFDLNAGALVASAGVVGTPVILSVGNGWYWISITLTATASASSSTGALVLIASGSDTRLAPNALTTAFYAFGVQQVVGSETSSLVQTTTAAATRGLPVFTETVPAGRTKALLSYADGTTTQTTGLTPGGTFDVATAVIGASKGRFGVSELAFRTWQA